jgi:hypothetical protein
MAVLTKFLQFPTNFCPRSRSLLFVVFMALLPSAIPDISAAAEPQEYQIKAIFLFNFAQFVQWPAEAFPATDTPLVIGILGEDPFGSYIDEAVQGERINDRPIVIRRFKSVEEVGTCHILYISNSEAGQIDQIMTKVKGRSILTVSDMDEFGHRGGMIRFLIRENRVQLRINVESAKAAGLKISSKLLRPAEIVSRRSKTP